MKSQQANVHFNANGIPVADRFDDVYFSNDSGIDETQYVFIEGNDLEARWRVHSTPHFVIGETGFGTGLNFLVVMQAFSRFRKANPTHPLKRLFFVSTEKYPLSSKDIQQALLAFPTLSHEITTLINHYPICLEGCHRRHFSEFSTTLDVWIGDAHDMMPQWHSPVNGCVDAWFLDGFAPSKNPDMWADTLFEQMARLSKPDATFSTFTAAGVVKRGLAKAGFKIVKRKGFGRKREMLTGSFNSSNVEEPQTTRSFPGPYYRYHQSPLRTNSHVMVIGSGLAAATCVLALAKRGMKITLCFDEPTLATGASGNPQGGFYPQLHSQASIASRIQAHGFLYANHMYRNILGQDTAKQNVAFDFCGVAQLNFNENVAVRQKKLVENQVWPDALIKYVDDKALSEKAGIPLPYDGLFIEQGGWISPPDLVNALLAEAHQYAAIDVKPEHVYQSHSIHNDDSTLPKVNVCFANGSAMDVDHLILATGAGAVTSSAFSSLPLRPVRGQVEAINSQAPIDKLSTVLCHKGYLTPAFKGRHALGSTYVKNDLSTDVRVEETEQNLQTHQKAMAKVDIIETLSHDGTARAATRLGSPDHQPLAGSLTDFNAMKGNYLGLSVGKPLHTAPALPEIQVSTVCCLGSRGLTTAPLMAELLASMLSHEPLPLNNDLCQAVDPVRFMVRESIRGAEHT